MDPTDANLLTLDPSQFTLDENFDFLTKNTPSLSDVELLIGDYTLETPPASIPLQYFTPEPWNPTGPPNRNCYTGPYDFKVEVSSSDVNKKKYLYSHRLHRIYVDMEADFSLHFDWRAPPGAGAAAPHTMFVRATVVFSDDAQAEKRVERCTQHYYQNAKQEPDAAMQVVLKNVLHSSRELGSASVQYCGSPRADDQWLSVRVELSKPSDQPVAHAYKFVCKNSCPNGINRRPICILFTLEDQNQQVYGRQAVGARVCACPRRDMYKDEEAEGARGAAPAPGKRRARHAPAASAAPVDRPAKKIKVEAGVGAPAADLIVLPELEVVGARAAVTGLEVMRNMMQQALEAGGGAPRAAACLQRLQAVIDELRGKHNL